MTIYNELRAEIARAGRTIGEVCEALGLSRQSFWMRCTGRTDFRLSELKMLSDMLNLTPADRERLFFS